MSKLKDLITEHGFGKAVRMKSWSDPARCFLPDMEDPEAPSLYYGEDQHGNTDAWGTEGDDVGWELQKP